MAYIINISAIISYENNEVNAVALTRDEFGNISVNDGSQNQLQMQNIDGETDCFTTAPISGFTFTVSSGSVAIKDVILSITAINDNDQCLIRYENGEWTTVNGDIEVVNTVFADNAEEVVEIFESAGIAMVDIRNHLLFYKFDETGSVPDGSNTTIPEEINGLSGIDDFDGIMLLADDIAKLLNDGASDVIGAIPPSGSLVNPITNSDNGIRLKINNLKGISEFFKFDMQVYGDGVGNTKLFSLVFWRNDGRFGVEETSSFDILNPDPDFILDVEDSVDDFFLPINLTIEYRYDTSVGRVIVEQGDTTKVFKGSGSLLSKANLTDVQIDFQGCENVTIGSIELLKI